MPYRIAPQPGRSCVKQCASAPATRAVGHVVGRLAAIERTDVDDGACVEINQFRGVEDLGSKRVHRAHAIGEITARVHRTPLALDAERARTKPLEHERTIGQRRLHRETDAPRRCARARAPLAFL